MQHIIGIRERPFALTEFYLSQTFSNLILVAAFCITTKYIINLIFGDNNKLIRVYLRLSIDKYCTI